MRYGTIKYGQAHYGATPADDRLLWTCQFDWNRDGSYDRNESPWLQDVLTRRGRENLMRTEAVTAFSTSGVGFELPTIGEAVVYLDNEDGRYDAYNAASPLYPNIRPGVYARIRITQNGVTKNLFTGRVADIIPKEATKQVMIRMVDGTQVQGDRQVRVPMQTNRRVDLAVGDVLDAIEWPESWGRNLSSFSDYLPYYWADGITARQALRDLMDLSVGVFFVAGDGKATILPRYRTDTPTVNLEEERLGKDLTLRQPWETVYNRISIRAYPREAQASAELWRLSGVPDVAAGETLTIWASYTYNSSGAPALSLETLVAGSDYTMNTVADGSGVDLTADFVVTVTRFAETAKIELLNNSASLGKVTLLKLRGVAIIASQVTVTVEDTGSQALYGVRDLVLDVPWMQSVYQAKSIAAFLLLLAAASEFPRVTMVNQFDDQFQELFTRVGLSVPSKHLAYAGESALQVGYIEHSSNGNLQEVVTVMYLERPIIASSATWVFPTQIGVTSIFGV